MEKLQPILTHKFWILLGIAIILPLVGWYMASASLASTYSARVEELEKAKNSIPPASNPNQTWADQLAQINKVQEQRNEQAEEFLWQQQRAEMTWPGNVQSFAEQIPYRGSFPTVARELYRTSYPFEIERLWQIVRPHDPRKGEGVVDFSQKGIPQQDWGDLPPTSDEMWDCQEDVWLVESLLESIAAVNGDSNRIEAPILVIKLLNLMGGDRSTIGSEGGESGDYMGGGEDMMAEAMPGGGFGGGRQSTRGGRQTGPVNVEFDVTEEFGSARASGGAETTDTFGSEGADMYGGGSGGAKAKRYVDDDENLPYKTRGFYLSLVMDHRSLPELIAELTNTNWPVQVVRVQQAMIHEDDTTGASLGRGRRGSRMYEDMESGMTDMPDAEYNYDTTGGGIGGGIGGGMTSPTNDAAMTNPYLANVTLAGLITIYKPLEETEGEEEGLTEEEAEQLAEEILGDHPSAELATDAAATDAATDTDAAITEPAETAPADEAPADENPAGPDDDPAAAEAPAANTEESPAPVDDESAADENENGESDSKSAENLQ